MDFAHEIQKQIKDGFKMMWHPVTIRVIISICFRVPEWIQTLMAFLKRSIRREIHLKFRHNHFWNWQRRFSSAVKYETFISEAYDSEISAEIYKE